MTGLFSGAQMLRSALVMRPSPPIVTTSRIFFTTQMRFLTAAGTVALSVHRILNGMLMAHRRSQHLLDSTHFLPFPLEKAKLRRCPMNYLT
jgi:hypothetical protein